MRTVAIGLAAMLSGGAALVYEISWSRALVVPLGNSADATSLVLAAFMVGIAAGAHLGGDWSERVKRPLCAYAAVEVALAAAAVAAPLLLSQLSEVGSGTRHLLALALIVPPCLAMGASFPFLVRALTELDRPLAHRISLAYGANTAGAALGACLTGFWGIAAYGVGGCSHLGAVASASAAAIAWFVARRSSEPVSTWPDSHEPAVLGGSRSHPGSPRPGGGSPPALLGASTTLGRVALGAAFASGLVMLACEVLWARTLTFVFGHDTYAFASLLATVLSGLALGGALHRLLARRNQANSLAVLLTAFSLSLVLSFWGAAALVIERGRDPFGLDAAGALTTSAWLELYRELLYTPLLLGIPSVLAGTLYPTCCSLYAGDAGDAGRKVGKVGWINGLGGAAGALVGATGLVPLLGIQEGLVALALVPAALAALVVLSERARLSVRHVGWAAVPLLLSASTLLVMPAALPRGMLLRTVGERHQRLLHYEEGRTGTVSVIENTLNGERQLLINGVNEVTTRLVHDQSFKALGHLGPLLFGPASPKRVVMICLGAGLSAGAVIQHPIERLDVVDLSAAVAAGAEHFAAENNGVLGDARFTLHIDDGRQFLLNAREGYDVAVVDSTHPKAVDSWILYTQEFYRLLERRLVDGGVVVQWLPLHGLSEQEFKIVVHTFQSVFPHMTLWANAGFETYGQVAYAKLVARVGASRQLGLVELASRLDRLGPVRKDLEPFAMQTLPAVADGFVASSRAVREWTRGLPVQTDDRPVVPYTTRYSRGRRMEPALLLTVRERLGSVYPDELSRLPIDTRQALEQAHTHQGLVLSGQLHRALALAPGDRKLELYARQAQTTRPYYTRLAATYADDVDRLFEAGTQLATLGHPDSALPILERAHGLRPHDFRVRLNLALVFQALGEQARAIDLLTELRKDHYRSALVHQNLGAATLAAGDAGVAAGHLQQAVGYAPDSTSARLLLADALLAIGRHQESMDVVAPILELNPWVAAAHHVAGQVAMRKQDCKRAETSLGRAQKLAPYTTEYLYDWGLAQECSGAPGRAAHTYRRIIHLDPDHARALNRLGVLLRGQGRLSEAAEYSVRALEADPSLGEAAFNLGSALRDLGRRASAVQAFCLALKLDRGAPQGHEAPSRQALEQLGANHRTCQEAP